MSSGTDKKRILLVDYDEIHLSITVNMLKEQYDILTAKSGREAIDFFYQGLFPDLVLLDIIMPTMDGWELFNRIKAISLLKEIPVLFFTAVKDESAERQAYGLGATDYIMKPCDQADLLNRVSLALGME